MKRGICAAFALLISATTGGADAFQLTDSLKGSTVGNPVGGSIGANGWTVTDRTDRLWYAIPAASIHTVHDYECDVANLIVADNEL
jgi:hypothetical protein